MKYAVESVLMQAVATYVLRMLPTENLPSSSLPYHQQGPSSALTESRLTTPLRLILPTSPYLNRVNYGRHILGKIMNIRCWKLSDTLKISEIYAILQSLICKIHFLEMVKQIIDNDTTRR